MLHGFAAKSKKPRGAARLFRAEIVSSYTAAGACAV
jgi:hypothetical protein